MVEISFAIVFTILNRANGNGWFGKDKIKCHFDNVDIINGKQQQKSNKNVTIAANG